MSLWRNIVACLFLSIAGCAYAQQLPPPGGGGSTGGGSTGGGSTQPPIGGASIKTTISGKDTWKCPTRNDSTGNWSIKEVIHDYDQNAWFVDGVRKTIAPIPTGWSSAPTPMTGSLEKNRTYKFTIQIPVAEHLNSVWVAVKSDATAEMSPEDIRIADNGQGDFAVEAGPWGHLTSSGTHLRKVAIDENGFGEWTVKVYAYASATHTSGIFIAEVSSSLVRDPRVISLPLNYKKKELSETDTFTMDYMEFGEKDTMVSTGPNTSVKVGVEPTKITKQLSVTFNKTEKEVNHPESTDALSLKMDFFRTSPYGVVEKFVDHGTISGTRTTGSGNIDLDFGSKYLGAIDPNMWPVLITATHESTTNSVSLSADYGEAPSVVASISRDHTYRDLLPPVPDVTVNNGQASGTYKSTFKFADGISGETSVSIIYKHTAELAKEKTMDLVHKPTDGANNPREAKDAFKPIVTTWCSGHEATVLLQPGNQNEVMLVNSALSVGFAYFLASNPATTIGAVVVLACVEAGFSGSLDSTSEFGRVESTFLRDLNSKYWTVTNFTDFNFPTGTTAASIRYKCDWMLDGAPSEVAHAQARDIWNENGYSKRGGKEAWTSPAIANAGNNYEPWYKFKYNVDAGSGGGSQTGG